MYLIDGSKAVLACGKYLYLHLSPLLINQRGCGPAKLRHKLRHSLSAPSGIILVVVCLPRCCLRHNIGLDVRYLSRRELFRLNIVAYDAADTLQAPGLGQGGRASGRPCARTAIRPPVAAKEPVTSPRRHHDGALRSAGRGQREKAAERCAEDRPRLFSRPPMVVAATEKDTCASSSRPLEHGRRHCATCGGYI
jgi:hypothetical protein